MPGLRIAASPNWMRPWRFTAPFSSSAARACAEAEEESLPLEVIEYRAVRAAAADIAQQYGVSERRATKRISALVADYAE